MDSDFARLAEIITGTPGAAQALAEARRVEDPDAARVLCAIAADLVCESHPDLFTPADPIRLRDFLVRMFLPHLAPRRN